MLSDETMTKIFIVANQQEAAANAIDEMHIPTTTDHKLLAAVLLLGEAARASAEAIRLLLLEFDSEDE